MEIKIEVTDQTIDDTLCAAFEGGSAYWARIDRGTDRAAVGARYSHEIPMRGGVLQLVCPDYPECIARPLDRAAIAAGLKLMAEQHPRHFADMIGENGDATTGDVLVQLAVFGELVFG